MESDRLIDALQTLGSWLAERGEPIELALVGGGALLLHDLRVHPTEDLDAIARHAGGRWRRAHPFPEVPIEGIREVGLALDLPVRNRDGKDWLNTGPSVLMDRGLPPGFFDRMDRRTFGHLTIHLASPDDLVALKVLAATDTTRGAKRAVDLDDIARTSPTGSTLAWALRWVASFDGRPDFLSTEGMKLLDALAERGLTSIADDARAHLGLVEAP